VGGNSQNKAERGARPPFEREDGVGSHPCKEGASRLPSKEAMRESVRRTKSAKAKPSQRKRILGNSQRAKQRRSQLIPVGYKRLHQTAVRPVVLAERLGCQVNRAIDHYRLAAIQGMCDG